MSVADHQALARTVRPKIAKLARQGKAVDAAFKATRAALFPDATPGEIANLRTMFFAGAAELSALQMYGVSDGDDITEGDEMLFGQIMEEIERRHGRAIQLALAEFGGEQ